MSRLLRREGSLRNQQKGRETGHSEGLVVRSEGYDAPKQPILKRRKRNDDEKL
jgi:hypothetical protein